MKEILIPAQRDLLTNLIQTYFYGCFPYFQIRKDDGSRSYLTYDYHSDGYTRGKEPQAHAIIQDHIAGEDTWAVRAVQDDRAHFAALDVDTTDENLLDELKQKLDETYGSIYNWERSQSGVHVWFLWEETIELSLAIDFISLLELPPKLESVIDIRYPKEAKVLRLPFPGSYDPPSSFTSDHLVVLEKEDIEGLVGAQSQSQQTSSSLSSSDIYRGSSQRIREAVIRTNILSGKNPKQNYPTMLSNPSSYDPEEPRQELLKSEVDRFLLTDPEDHHVYEKLIGENLIANTISVYGEKMGLRLLEGWIDKGSASHKSRRIRELHAYHRNNQRNDWKPLNGALCRPEDMEHFQFGMFGDVLKLDDALKYVGKEKKEQIQENAEQVLYILLVSEWVAREHNRKANVDSQKLIPFISTRQLAWLMELDDVDESGRRQAGTARSYLTYGDKSSKENSLGIFQVVEQATEFKSPRFVLNPEYEHLLDRVYEVFGAEVNHSTSYPQIAKCREQNEATYTSKAKMVEEVENEVVEAEKSELEDLNECGEEVIQVTSLKPPEDSEKSDGRHCSHSENSQTKKSHRVVSDDSVSPSKSQTEPIAQSEYDDLLDEVELLFGEPGDEVDWDALDELIETIEAEEDERVKKNCADDLSGSSFSSPSPIEETESEEANSTHSTVQKKTGQLDYAHPFNFLFDQPTEEMDWDRLIAAMKRSFEKAGDEKKPGKSTSTHSFDSGHRKPEENGKRNSVCGMKSEKVVGGDEEGGNENSLTEEIDIAGYGLTVSYTSISTFASSSTSSFYVAGRGGKKTKDNPPILIPSTIDHNPASSLLTLSSFPRPPQHRSPPTTTDSFSGILRHG